MIVIVDTNILFSSLRSKNSTFRDKLFIPSHTFYTPNFLIVELFKHKERIFKKSNASGDEINEFLNKILQRIHFINEETISISNFQNAYSLCQGIDEADTPFVALTLELDGKLWTMDKVLKKGLAKKGFHKFIDNEDF